MDLTKLTMEELQRLRDDVNAEIKAQRFLDAVSSLPEDAKTRIRAKLDELGYRPKQFPKVV